MTPEQLAAAFTKQTQIREQNFAELTRIHDIVIALDPCDASKAQCYFERVPQFEQPFQEAQAAIKKLNKSVSQKDRIDTEEVQHAVYDLIVSIEAVAKDLHRLNTAGSQTQSSGHVPYPVAMLPKIELPSFNGNIELWPEYLSLFNSLIHENASLNNAQKFHYLKSSLRDEAASVISEYEMNTDNYLLAYNSLLTRYQNKRRIAFMYLNKMMDFKPLASANLHNLKQFLNLFQTSINALQALKLENVGDFMLFSLVWKKLDPYHRKIFENKRGAAAMPTYKELLEFINHQVQTMELNEPTNKVAPVISQSKRAVSNVLIVDNPTASVASHPCVKPRFPSPSKDLSCPLCRAPHLLYRCPAYQSYPGDRRSAFVRNNKRCFNCLGQHPIDGCRSRGSCQHCGSRRHHTSLHIATRKALRRTPIFKPEPSSSKSNTTPVRIASPPLANPPSNGNSNVSSAPSTLHTLSVNTAPATQHQVLLGTAQITIADHRGKLHYARAVIDPGSQVSSISLACARAMRLKIKPVASPVSGIAQVVTQPIGLVKCKILPPAPNPHFALNALVLPSISNPLPAKLISDDTLRKFNQIPLADKHFHVPSDVDVLLGADVYPHVMVHNQDSPILGQPSAIATCFGWIIVGPIENSVSHTPPEVLLFTCTLSDALTKFWEMEEVNVPIPANPLDKAVEDHFVSTHRRDNDGRYVVALPFKSGSTPMSSNAAKSKHLFYNLEARLKRSNKHADYHAFMTEYLALGHMSLANDSAPYVIPHHVVTKLASTTTKIRVVFNASDPDQSGLSLNDRLHSGPKLQKDISDVLMAFRLHVVALCGDIEKMYRQIKICASDKQFQRIFWRANPEIPCQEYELNTVTYGVTPSAYLAIRVLQQLVHDEGEEYPAASSALSSQTYVDDVISGADSVDQALLLRDQLCDLLHKGGFELRKFASSHPEVLQGLPPDRIETKLMFSGDEHIVKILGLGWEPNSDTFSFAVLPFKGATSKRSILSYIARIFDPMGFLAPIIMKMKIILQRLWLAKVGWDEPSPPNIEHEWLEIVGSIQLLSGLKILRPVVSDQLTSISLVGFADASEKGYSAVLFICAHYEQQNRCSMWKAKTKLAPLKSITIPHLELSGALLLSELVRNASRVQLPVPMKCIRLFSDSEIVLTWLLTPPHALKTFVANRVVRIADNAPSAIWGHIGTAHNPADMASRGLTPEQFMDAAYNHLWFHGPSFLSNDHHQWPPPFYAAKKLATIPELKDDAISGDPVINPDLRVCCDNSLINVDGNPWLLETLSRFSSFTKLRRIFAYVLRFISNCSASRRAADLLGGPLKTEELQAATDSIVFVTQSYYFHAEINQLRHNVVPSKLLPLAPFLDPRGLVRVGGRLMHSTLSANAKHPLLVPKDAHLSRILCAYYHQMSLHSGPTTTQALLRAQFWILSARGLVRKVIRSCVTCMRFRGTTFQPQMATLPAARVVPSRAFTAVGIDFAGPFMVKSGNPRKPRITKGYLCLFICMASKAVHLEFASELTTAAFLGCLDRFIARRGLPAEIYSDRGRNFVGAMRHLREVHQFLLHQDPLLSDTLAARHIRWHLNPPYAPNFGGLWEAGIKSVKTLLVRLIGETPQTFEVYCTLFAKIEAILNSRPLCPLSDDPSEACDYLSPGHFLIGAPLVAVPELPILTHESIRSQWQYICQKSQHFWLRWSREYLNTLMQRQKWHKSAVSPQVGDLVLVKGINTSPLEWPLARIQTLLLGKDGVERVAALRMGDKDIIRSLRSLIPFSR